MNLMPESRSHSQAFKWQKVFFVCISSHLIKTSAERNQNLLLGSKKEGVPSHIRSSH